MAADETLPDRARGSVGRRRRGTRVPAAPPTRRAPSPRAGTVPSRCRRRPRRGQTKPGGAKFPRAGPLLFV